MKTDLLLRLADFCETIPQEKFKMNIWMESCGSAGCLIDHAVIAGIVPGLELARHGLNGVLLSAFWPHLAGSPTQEPEWNATNWNFGAIAKALDICPSDANWLFGTDGYDLMELSAANPEPPGYPEDLIPTSWVAARIRAFVAEHQPSEEPSQ